MLLIKENEIKHFSFGVEVKGSKETPKARLIFESKSGIKMFPAFLEDETYKVSLPYEKLKDLKEGKVYFEVLVGKNYFQPWQDNFALVYSTIQESKKQIEEVAKSDKKEARPSDVITENKKVEKQKIKPTYEKIRREYINELKNQGILFLEGETFRNFEIKKKTLVMLENKYGRQVRQDLLKLNSIKLDELLIF